MSAFNIDHQSNQMHPVVEVPDFRDLGRPMDTEWVEDFEDRLLELAQGHTNFRKRTVPGIVYALRREIVKSFHTGIVGDFSSVPNLVDKLVSVQVFNEDIALNGLTVAVKELSIKPMADNNLADIRILVGDSSCSSYQGGYAITGEKHATQKTLDLSRDQRSADREPRHYLTIGTITDPESLLNTGFLIRLRDSLSREINFGPIGEVRAVTDHT